MEGASTSTDEGVTLLDQSPSPQDVPDFPFNPALLNKLMNERLARCKEYKLDILEVSQQTFVAVLEVPGLLYQFSSPECRNATLATAHVAEHFLTHLKEDISRFRVVSREPTESTPLEALERFRVACQAETQFVIQKPECLLRFVTAQGTYFVKYGYHKDHSYVKHKLAVEFLRRASSKWDGAWEYYQQALGGSKQLQFVMGRIMHAEEDRECEYKAGEAGKPMEQKKVFELVKEKVGQTLCGFLNSDQGGCVYFGVEDDPRVIRGVMFKDSDNAKRSVQQIIMDNIKPDTSSRVRVDLYPVSVFSLEPLAPLPTRPQTVEPYTEAVEQEVKRLRQHIELLPSSKFETPLYILVITVLPPLETRASQLFFCNGRAYVRHNAQTVALDIEEMKKRVIEEYLASARLVSLSPVTSVTPSPSPTPVPTSST